LEKKSPPPTITGASVVASSAHTVDSTPARAHERDGDARARLRAAVDATDDGDDDASGGDDGTPRRKNYPKCPNGWTRRRAVDDARATVRPTRGISVLVARSRL